MKIQSQARLLIAGIVLVPLLIVLGNVIYRNFLNVEEEFNIPAYEDVSSLMYKEMSAGDWESLIRIIARSRMLGEVVIFRNDYLVLYSTNTEFTAGVFIEWENVMSLLQMKNQPPRYILSSQNLEETWVYILTKTRPPQSRPEMRPVFISAATILFLIIILILFTVIMTIVIARSITRSVQVLENATRRIAEGELDLKVDIKGSNEITSLTNSLNKMRSALKEDELRRSRFIMGISHDLKTPLALIKGYAEAIEDNVTEDPASRTDAAEIIITKADQLEGMINDLIDFVRMDTGEWRAQLEHVNLASFLQNLVKTMSADVELLRHEFKHTIDLPENLSVPMDERLALRAFENLINNAVRYTPEGSEIRFTAALSENTAELKISNDGPGIDGHDLPHVFEMLYRGSSSRREQGMGLGLAVVKWVADYHGWAISVSSEAGKETRFVITVPLQHLETA